MHYRAKKIPSRQWLSYEQKGGEKNQMSSIQREHARDLSRTLRWEGKQRNRSMESVEKLDSDKGRAWWQAYYCTPQAVIEIVAFGRPPLVPSASTFLTTSIPWMTSPNTTCFSSSHDVITVVMKNCDRSKFDPELVPKVYVNVPENRLCSGPHSPWTKGLAWCDGL